MTFNATLRWLDRAYHHKGETAMGWTFMHLTPATPEDGTATCFFHDEQGRIWKTSVTLDKDGLHWQVIHTIVGVQVVLEEADEIEKQFFQLTLEKYRTLVESANKWRTLLAIKDRLDEYKDSLPPTPRV